MALLIDPLAFFSAVKRFSALLRAIDGATQKMLTQRLREMKQDGIVHHKVYTEVPPKWNIQLLH